MFETKTFKNLNKFTPNNFPEWLIIHHSGGGENNPFLKTSHHTANSVENYHLSRGWDGIGYHYFIELNGDVWKGRPEHRNGAHCKEQSMNNKSLGICIAGNFDVETPSQAQMDSLKGLVKGLVQKHNIKKDRIVGHRKFATYKSCPGNKFSDSLIASLSEIADVKIDLSKVTTKELLEELISRLK